MKKVEQEERQITEAELLNHIRAIRLHAAKRYFAERLAYENQPQEKVGEKVSAFIQKTGAKMRHYHERNARTEISLAALNAEYPNPYTDEEIQAFAADFFAKGQGPLTKLLFGVKVILDDDYHFEKEEEGLKEASQFLYGDPDTLLSIKKKLMRYYQEIAKRELSPEEKGVLIGCASLALVGSFVLPLAAVGPVTAASLTAAGLAKMTAISASMHLLSGALISGTYFMLDEVNRIDAKRDFLEFTPERQALSLAIELLVVDEMKGVLEEGEYKERLDNILKTLQEFKGDIDYLLFVENQNTDGNKSKLTQFHRFDKAMLRILA